MFLTMAAHNDDDNNNTTTTAMDDAAAALYVVTAHPSGAVLTTCGCHFTSPTANDVLIAKPGRLEVRQYDETNQACPVTFSWPVYGRIVTLLSFRIASCPTDVVFFLTDQLQYAVIVYNNNNSADTANTTTAATAAAAPVYTIASGTLDATGDMNNAAVLGRRAETGPLVALDLQHRCIVAHVWDGLLTVVPIKSDFVMTTTSQTAAAAHYVLLPGPKQVLGRPFHGRIEERTVLAITCIINNSSSTSPPHPQVALLYQDAHGLQHLTTHVVHVGKQQLHLHGNADVPNMTWLKKSAVDGGSAVLIPTPHGVIIVGQTQLTLVGPHATKMVPFPQALVVTYCAVPAAAAPAPPTNANVRFLLGDEFGNLHLLTLVVATHDKVVSMPLETLGSCVLSSSLCYLGNGVVWVGSALGDPQLVQIHDEPVPLEDDNDAADDDDDDEMDHNVDTTYLTVLDEYTHLGPILDLCAVTNNKHDAVTSQVVTASGSSKWGTLRVIRNGIGMDEYAAVSLPGVQAMWSVRAHLDDPHDTYLVQSFVGETRVLGVVAAAAGADGNDEKMQDDDDDGAPSSGGTLEEVELPGLDGTMASLYVGNVVQDRLVQITQAGIRLIGNGVVLDSWTYQDVINSTISVATGNAAGQLVVALSGGFVVTVDVLDDKLVQQMSKCMDREVSCLDVRPFRDNDAMDTVLQSEYVAVGLWDDFTVRILSRQGLNELVRVELSDEDEESGEDAAATASTEPADTGSGSVARRNRNNMMARSLCLVTMDFANTNNTTTAAAAGVNMLFVGLGDGTLISFAVVTTDGTLSVQSKKEVCLGSQRIDLVPLTASSEHGGGRCVLATGDRPTVIYLAGVGGSIANVFNPKLCYSNVNLSPNEDEDDGSGDHRTRSQQSIAVNVAASFFSPLLFDTSTMGSQHYSLCVADDANLRLGVIDDIQKLHVTKCRLGMSPRRIVHCPDGRLFAVGCIESGIKHFSLGGDEFNMGNCVRFMDDTSFDDIERIDLEPYEMVLSMEYAVIRMPEYNDEANDDAVYRSFLFIGTAYALPDEDEPTRGRILVYSCQGADDTTQSQLKVRQVTDFTTTGGVYSMCQFYDGLLLAAVNSKTTVIKMVKEAGVLKLQYQGYGHHGHILSLSVRSLAKYHTPTNEASDAAVALKDAVVDADKDQENATDKVEKLAIVGDLMRSISLMQYYPEHSTLEEIARDFETNWTTAVEMLSNNTYLGAENWHNLYCLRRNTNANASDDVRCRLLIVGEYHLGEMVNKFMRGSLVMPTSKGGSSHRRAVRRANATASPAKKSSGDKQRAVARRNVVVTTVGSPTLFGTVDGSLGVVLGLDNATAAFFICLERCMAKTVVPVGGLSHALYRSSCVEHRGRRPAHGFVDGDLLETFLDLDRTTMEAIVTQMNRDGSWDVDDKKTASASEDEGEVQFELSVDDVLATVEEMSMLH